MKIKKYLFLSLMCITFLTGFRALYLDKLEYKSVKEINTPVNDIEVPLPKSFIGYKEIL